MDFVAGMRALRVGDPMDESTDIGPLATAQILEDLEDQVQQSVAAGARILTGGRRFNAGSNLARGHYYEPTVLVDIPKGSPAYNDEIFGPVASLFRVNNIDEAIALANATPFGLGASAWTKDPDEQSRFIEEMKLDRFSSTAWSLPIRVLPFWWRGRSGYGRELSAFGNGVCKIKTFGWREPFGSAVVFSLQLAG